VDPIHLNPKSVIFGLAAVTSIPFVVSSIILIGWGNQPVAGGSAGESGESRLFWFDMNYRAPYSAGLNA